MSKFWIGNFYLLCATLCASGSQVMLKALLNKTGPLSFNRSFVDSLFSSGRALHLAIVLVLLVAGFLFWVMSLSRLDVSYAYAVACSSALIVTFLGVVFLGETVSPKMWWGTVMIVLGTVLLAPSR